ncbi:hypothetical protein RSP03_43730 [Cereibacter sphaeroides]|nr:hypothetical protein RSP03_43730 [Cereibacter sphaeroides]
MLAADQFYITVEHWTGRKRRRTGLRTVDDALRRDRAVVATAHATVVPDG